MSEGNQEKPPTVSARIGLWAGPLWVVATLLTLPPGDMALEAWRCAGLAIAYSANIGGVATLIGTPPNALLAGYLSSQTNMQIGFAQWMSVGLPVAIVMTWSLPGCAMSS